VEGVVRVSTAGSSGPTGAATGTGSPHSKSTSEYWRSKTDEEWKKALTPEQYRIARQAGTERAFTGAYWQTKTPGTYLCGACGRELFRSQDKFDSGTGWPSYVRPHDPQAVTQRRDGSHHAVRTEVRCGRCDAHLGHVFTDGPAPTGLRYCINSAVLDLRPLEPGR
jgi:peptide-methionine (R)-S-oxide reductase